MPGEMIEGKYSVELVTGDSEGDGLREVLYRHDNLSLVRALYHGCVKRYSGRVLYDRKAAAWYRGHRLKLALMPIYDDHQH